jgi:NAD(P)-dependent dehydrogenase (short-subunit alcohol dehydrogenase family)
MLPQTPVVLVTAGSAGLGAAAAVHFARNGYNVIINYCNNETRAEKVLATLNSAGEKTSGTAQDRIHAVIRADLEQRDEVDRLVHEAYNIHGRLDVIFSNGGWTQFRDTRRLSDNAFDTDWNHAFTANVKSHMWLLHAAETYLAEHDGAFITTASVAGVRGIGSSLVSLQNLVICTAIIFTSYSPSTTGLLGGQGSADPHGQGSCSNGGAAHPRQ